MDRVVCSRDQEEILGDGVWVAVVRFGPSAGLGIGRLGRDVRYGVLAVFIDVRVDHDRSSGVVAVVPLSGADNLVRCGHGAGFEELVRYDHVVSEEVRDACSVGPAPPELVEPHLVAVGVFPSRKDNSPVVKDRRFDLVFVGERELLYVVAVLVASVQVPGGVVPSAVAAPERLASRGDEHYPAVGQVARIVVFDKDRGAVVPCLELVAFGSGKLADPRSVDRGLPEEKPAEVFVFLGVIAERKHHAFSIVAQVGVAVGPGRHFAFEKRFDLGISALPVGKDRQALADAAVPTEVLVAVVAVQGRGGSVYQDAVEIDRRLTGEEFQAVGFHLFIDRHVLVDVIPRRSQETRPFGLLFLEFGVARRVLAELLDCLGDQFGVLADGLDFLQQVVPCLLPLGEVDFVVELRGVQKEIIFLERGVELLQQPGQVLDFGGPVAELLELAIVDRCVAEAFDCVEVGACFGFFRGLLYRGYDRRIDLVLLAVTLKRDGRHGLDGVADVDLCESQRQHWGVFAAVESRPLHCRLAIASNASPGVDFRHFG